MTRLSQSLFAALALFVAMPALAAKPSQRARKIASEQKKTRVEHAREVLGKHYKKSVVRVGEKFADFHPFVQAWTRENYKGDKKHVNKLARAIVREAHRHEFDPAF